VIKQRRMRWGECRTCIDETMINAYKALIRRPERKMSHDRPNRGWEDIIK
jgi:hypothetical protein